MAYCYNCMGSVSDCTCPSLTSSKRLQEITKAADELAKAVREDQNALLSNHVTAQRVRQVLAAYERARGVKP